ncbi:hypothetical protein [Streptomyces sp. NPDC002845]
MAAQDSDGPAEANTRPGHALPGHSRTVTDGLDPEGLPGCAGSASLASVERGLGRCTVVPWRPRP